MKLMISYPNQIPGPIFGGSRESGHLSDLPKKDAVITYPHGATQAQEY